MKKRLIVGITGASGVPLAVQLLEELRKQSVWESHLVISDGAVTTISQETKLSVEDVCALADRVYSNNNIGEAIASGTFRTEGMVIVPCSMKTAAGINSGYSDNLLLRAADVTLKERRRLVLVVRETPLSTIHLRNLYELSTMGAIILPPMLTYYHCPENIKDMTHHIVCKILSFFGIWVKNYQCWNGLK